MTYVVRTLAEADTLIDSALPKAIEALEMMIADPATGPAMRARLERAVAKYRGRADEPTE